MRKGFTRKPQGDEPATRGKNYITPSGLQRLKEEHRFLLTRERPAVTKVVAWAASNGDRSENADYQYGKRRLRQIDGRILRSNRALCQCCGNGASGEHRGHRRGRSRPQPYQLDVASGTRVDEVGGGRPRSAPGAGRYGISDGPRSLLRAHFCGTVP